MSTTSIPSIVSQPAKRTTSKNNVNPLQRESIKVMVRFRPSNKQEKIWDKQNRSNHVQSNTMEKIEFLPNNKLQISNHNGKRFTYNFDTVLQPSTTQRQVFAAVAEQTCDDILQGYNGTIFVYGQSGSGKTYSMYGPEERKDEMDISTFGIIPMSCAYIFAILNDDTHPLTENLVSYTVRCEFIEIYNEKLNDLLDPSKTPHIRELLIQKQYVPVIENVTTKQVNNLEECIAAIRVATGNRTVAYTNLNATSSRSHMVMRLIVTIETENGTKKTGIANFADLAGSEAVKKTGVQGKQLKEAGNILKSLSALSNVIDALEKGRKHVPFKDSKLTFMLSNSLGGNCKTILLLCGSGHALNRDESIRSIQFGMRCRNVQNTVCVNETRTKQQLLLENKQLKAEVEALKLNQLQLDQQELISEKLSEYENLNSELLDTIANSEQHVNTLTQQLHAMNEQNAEVLQRESEIVKEHQMLQEKYADLETTTLSESQQQQQQLDQTYEDVNAENIELKSENAALQTRLQKLQNELAALNDELHGYKHKLELEQQQTQNLESLVRTLKNESKKQLDNANKKHAELLQRLKEKQTSQSRHSAKLTLDIDVTHKKNDALLFEMETMKLELQELHTTNESLNASLKRHQNGRKTFDSENSKLQQQYSTLRSEYEALTKKWSKLQAESNKERAKSEQNIQHFKTKIETQRDRLQKATTQWKESEEKMAKYDVQIEAYESKIEEQTTQLKWLNAEKQEWQQKDRQREMQLQMQMSSTSTSTLMSRVSLVSPSATVSLQNVLSLKSIDEDSQDHDAAEQKEETDEKEEHEPAPIVISTLTQENREPRAVSMADWDAMISGMGSRGRRSAFVRPEMSATTPPALLNSNNNNHKQIQRKFNKRKQYKQRAMTTRASTKPTERVHKNNFNDGHGQEHEAKGGDDADTEDDNMEPVLHKYLSRNVADEQMGEQEVIVRRQTIALGSYFENHVQKQRQSPRKSPRKSPRNYKSPHKSQTNANDANDANDDDEKNVPVSTTPEGSARCKPPVIGPSESSLSLNEPMLRFEPHSDIYEALERAEKNKEKDKRDHEGKDEPENEEFRELSSSTSDHIDPTQELLVESPRLLAQSSLLQEIEGAQDTFPNQQQIKGKRKRKPMSDEDSMAAQLRREHLEKLQEEWAMADSTQHTSPKTWLAEHHLLKSGPLHAHANGIVSHPAVTYSRSMQHMEGVSDNILPKVISPKQPIIHHGHSASVNVNVQKKNVPAGSLNVYQLNKNARRSINVPHSGSSLQQRSDASDRHSTKLVRHKSQNSNPSSKHRKQHSKGKNPKQKRKSSSAKQGKVNRLKLIYDDNYDAMKEQYQKRKRTKQRFLSADVNSFAQHQSAANAYDSDYNPEVSAKLSVI